MRKRDKERQGHTEKEKDNNGEVTAPPMHDLLDTVGIISISIGIIITIILADQRCTDLINHPKFTSVIKYSTDANASVTVGR